MLRKNDLLPPNIDRKIGNILNVGVNSTPKAKLLAHFRRLEGKTFLVSFNPELAVASTEDQQLYNILANNSRNLADGVGISKAMKFLYGQGCPLIKGREFFWDLVSLANKKGWKVYLLGGEAGVAEKTRETLKLNFRKVSFLSNSGPKLDNQANPVSEVDRKITTDVVSEINQFKPHLLFVAFGAPKQEKWIYKNLPKLNVNLAMGVGGTFDYITGKRKLPPKWMEKHGLEWVWRLITQPKRIKRVINAALIFPLKIFLYKIKLE